MWGLLALCITLTGLNVAPRLVPQSLHFNKVNQDIEIDVQGAVTKPGVYKLPWGSNLQDAIIAAGGFSADAEQSLVNLARPLDAGEQLFIPTQQAAVTETRISINSATQLELESLPGIGPAMAQRIMDARPFNTVEDIQKVKGIGPKTFAKLLPNIKL